MYGMRCGALLCMASSAEIAKEFKDVMSVECRASWSNGNRAAMTVLAKIFEDKALRAKVDAERTHWMEVLAERGGVFMKAAEEAGLTACPVSYTHLKYDNSVSVNPDIRSAEISCIKR